MLALVLAALMLALALLSVLLYQSIRDDKVEARLNDLAIQAEEIAYLSSRRTIIGTQLESYLYKKARDVSEEFGAGILVLDGLGSRIKIGLEDDGSILGLSIEEANEYLKQVSESGEPIRVQSPAHRGGSGAAFTVVVPWIQHDIVMGAVFIHTSAQTIQASYQAVLVKVVVAMSLSAGLAAALLAVATRGVTRPVRRMARAAERIAHGEFDTHIPEGADEIGALATSFNRMASDLSRLEEMRRAFVSDVSHELRSPLTSMQGFLQGLLDGTIPDSEHGKYIQIVQDETRRMNRLVSSLLELSRIESGKAPLNLSRFDVNESIGKALIRHETLINDKNIEVDVQFRQDPCFVKADAERIDQVLTNLISNAIKYGGDTITIWTHTVNNLAYITVSDNGPGIPEEELPFIFERFHTVNKARTSGSGTGLGLAIVKKILDLHGHTISVTAGAGKGACFVFTLAHG